MAETSNEPLRRIFDEVCATAPEDAAVSVSFNQVGDILYKRRRSVEPALLTSAIESAEILGNHHQLCDAYQCHVTTEDGIAVIFHTQDQRRMIEGDGTYNASIMVHLKLLLVFFSKL